MNYLLFNNGILVGNQENVQRIEKGSHLQDILKSIDVARVCIVDVDVLVTTAVEAPIEKKDSILVRKFKEFYQHEEYIIQDERLDNNLFQVIGVKEQKVREVYSLISPEKVECFIPYGIALRNTLINKKGDLNKTVVFVDDWGSERLLTVFDGLKFSRTRVIANNGQDILPEIKRSQIDFFKKIEEYLSQKASDFVIVVNNQAIAAEISRNKEKIPVECIDVAYPALEGLKEIGTFIKYRLPEAILKERKEIELKKNVTTAIIALCVVILGLFYFLLNKVEWGVVNNQCQRAREVNESLDKKLRILDKETYRSDLRAHKSLNFGISYLSLLELIPPSYEVNSFKFTKSGRWHLEATLVVNDRGTLDSIPRMKILKNAEIKDVFINNQPGKHLRIIL